MRPLTYTRPKVMLPVANKPILEHLLVQAEKAGIREFIFIVGYHDEQVRHYFGGGERWGVSIDYCAQRKQLGTADALKMVEGLIDGSFLMMNGDTIVGRDDIKRIAKGKDITLSVIRVKDTVGLGVVELSRGRAVRIYEKTENPPSDMANAGLYLFTPQIWGAISQTAKSPRGEYEITDSLQLMIDSGQRILYQELSSWMDLSYPWDLLPANESLLSAIEAQNGGEVEENVVIKGAVSIGENTVIRSGSYIIGPAIIGQGCDLGPNCYIRPYTAIGNNCRIGGAVEIKNSIIMNGSKIPHHNYVGDSVIGEGCNLGAGTKIANLRLDKKDIWAAGINTKRRKLGAIMGDNVETGINACINVGCIIGNDVRIGPGAVVGGVIASGAKVL